MPLWKNRALNLTEQDCRYAMLHSKSNAGAARFIGCEVRTYKSYAQRYVDKESGKTLWDLHANPTGKGVTRRFLKGNNPKFRKTPMTEILEGLHPAYNRKKLQDRLIREAILEEVCSCCKFEERRVTDYKVPLVLCWIDGDKTNHKRENLELMCFNCYFLQYDDIHHRAGVARFKVSTK